MTNLVACMREWAKTPLIQRGHRGRMIVSMLLSGAEEIERLEAALATARRDALEEAACIVEAQPFFPDTHTGTRQQYVKDQAAATIRALAGEEKRP